MFATDLSRWILNAARQGVFLTVPSAYLIFVFRMIGLYHHGDVQSKGRDGEIERKNFDSGTPDFLHCGNWQVSCLKFPPIRSWLEWLLIGMMASNRGTTRSESVVERFDSSRDSSSEPLAISKRSTVLRRCKPAVAT